MNHLLAAGEDKSGGKRSCGVACATCGWCVMVEEKWEANLGKLVWRSKRLYVTSANGRAVCKMCVWDVACVAGLCWAGFMEIALALTTSDNTDRAGRRSGPRYSTVDVKWIGYLNVGTVLGAEMKRV